MAVTYESVQSATGSGTSITVTKPTGLAVGDVMVFIWSTNNTPGSVTATGWSVLTSVGPHSASDNYMNAYYKIADSSDTAASDFTHTINNSRPWVGAILRLSDCSADFVATVGTSTNDSTPTYSGGITPDAADSLFIMAISVDGSTNTSAYSLTTDNPTWTERVDTVSGSSPMLSIATATRSAVTASGDWNATISSSAESSSILTSVQSAQSVTITPTVLNVVSSIQEPTVGISKIFSVSPLTIASSVLTPTFYSDPWTGGVKSGAPTWTDATKNSSSWTDASKNSSTWSNQNKS